MAGLICLFVPAVGIGVDETICQQQTTATTTTTCDLRPTRATFISSCRGINSEKEIIQWRVRVPVCSVSSFSAPRLIITPPPAVRPSGADGIRSTICGAHLSARVGVGASAFRVTRPDLAGHWPGGETPSFPHRLADTQCLPPREHSPPQLC